MPDLSAIESIFAAALDRPSPEERAAYLDAACPTAEVRQHVDRLLSAHPRMGNFLDAGLTVDHEPIAERVGSKVGPYKLMEQIGEGGMGLVYVAEQFEPVRRKVAVKVIKPGMDSRDVIARFEAERQALALMDHPNIARVLDAGTTESGRPFFVMELVKGLPIIEYCDRQRLSARERLELFVTVCQAVQHAHSKGVIHRDLKPSNILVAPYDGVPVIKVIDFGVAKAVGQQLTDKTIYTRFQQMIGTPLYMSPEQAEINALDVDIRSDVYSLGVLLYELLTGTTPFDRKRFATAAYDEIRRIIKEEEPPRPSTRLSTLGETIVEVSAQRKIDPAKLASLVRGDLDWIVMKALEKDRGRRYETASAFAADIRHFLAEEPVEARPPSTTYRVKKFARRHRAAVVVSSAIVALLVSGFLGTGLGLIRAFREARRAQAALAEAKMERAAAADAGRKTTVERNNAVAAKERLRRSLYAADLQLAHAAWNAGNILGMRSLLDGQKPGPGESDLRGFEWDYLRRLGARFREYRPVPGSIGGVLSPDGRRFAHTWRVPLATPAKGEQFRFRLWDTIARQELPSVAPFPDAVIVTGWLIEAFSPDGKRYALPARIRDAEGHERWYLHVFECDTGRELFHLDDLADCIAGATFDPSARRLAAFVPRSAANDAEYDLKIWAVDGGKEHLNIPRAVSRVSAKRGGLAFSPDGASIAALTSSSSAQDDAPGGAMVRILDAESGKEIRRFATGAGALLAYSPDGKRLAVGERNFRVFDSVSGEQLFELKDETPSPSWKIAFSPDGSQLASSSYDGKLRIWDVKGAKPGASRPPARVLEGGDVSLCGLAWSALGETISASDIDGRILTWDLATSDDRLRIPGSAIPYFAGASSEDASRFCAVFAGDSLAGRGIAELRVWDRTGKILVALKDDALKLASGGVIIKSVKLSDTGNRVAYASANPGVLMVWEVETGRLLLRRDEERGWFEGPAFSPDGRRLAVSRLGKADRDEMRTSWVEIWDLDTGKEERKLQIPAEVHSSRLTFSRDGRRIATGMGGLANHSERGGLRVWNASTGELQLARESPALFMAEPRFSPDGALLAVAVADGRGPSEVKVLDAGTGEERLSLVGHRYQAQSLVFSPDGRRLASSAAVIAITRNEAEVKLWDLSSGRELLTLSAEGKGQLAFSPDGRRLFHVSAQDSRDALVKVWDATPLTEDRAVFRHE